MKGGAAQADRDIASRERQHHVGRTVPTRRVSARAPGVTLVPSRTRASHPLR